MFAAGSFLAATAHDIHMVILGRIIQGAGAISAAVIALTADLTRDEQRTKAMAIIGVTIGATFALSMVAGPVLGRSIGVPGIFALTGVLALSAMAVVRWVIPDPVRAAGLRVQDVAGIARVFRNSELARLNFGIFVLHAVLMALFVVVPFELRGAGLPAESHWQVYLPVMLGAFVLMVPPIFQAERRGRQKAVFLGAIGVLLAGQIGLVFVGQSVGGVACSLLLFFTGFNLLEASLPSLVSRTAPPAVKGTAIGVYSSAQALGLFVGGVVGGCMSKQHRGCLAVFGACAAVTLSWLAVAIGMQAPRSGGARAYPVPRLDAKRADGLSRKLADVSGVREAMVMAGEGVAYLEVDSARFDEQSVLELIAGEN